MHKPLGPKTGTFEAPSESMFDKPRVTRRLLKVDEQFKSTILYDELRALTDEIINAYERKNREYNELRALTAELINAYERKDKADIVRLIKEFRDLP